MRMINQRSGLRQLAHTFIIILLMVPGIANGANLTNVVGGWFTDPFFGLKDDGTVWQYNYWMAPTNIRPDFQVEGAVNVVDLSQSMSETLFLKADGTLWGLGGNSTCNLFDNSGSNGYTASVVTSPIQLTDFSNIKSINAGVDNTIIVKSDGTIWGKGRNANGELGDGTQLTRCAPVKALGFGNAKAVSSKGGHVLALNNDGAVWAWGYNGHGQLGNGTFNNNNIPEQVQGLSGITAIATSEFNSVALKNDGSVWVWGGYDEIKTPYKLSGLNGITEIAAGDGYVIALKSDGTVWMAGSFSSTWGSFTPITVVKQVSGISNVLHIGSGYQEIAAVKSDGTFWYWGYYHSSTPSQYADTVFEIDFTGNGSGTVSASGGYAFSTNSTMLFPQNTNVILKSNPTSGSTLTSWTGCDYVNGDQCTVGMNAAKKVNAQFDIQTFTMVTSSSGNGTINPTSRAVNYNDSFSFTITPNTGYTIDKLYDNGVDVSSMVWIDKSNFGYSLSHVTSNHTLQVSFKQGVIPAVPALSIPILILLASVLSVSLYWQTKR
ncbi:RCC1 domain-containing protein [Geomesophilobacter sediminis]|uniref:Bacterial repeat domain-containing protein n=1 Tax=Geomesophilobacter sediminis TaxID=2798584 RepID=A0A8J7JJ81_9BACT|nr:hypothetical protein [Geomesophilobacter sediminis]MBJ6724590.1 hypothetical protein [Geomesophilobacter sediminis]